MVAPNSTDGLAALVPPALVAPSEIPRGRSDAAVRAHPPGLPPPITEFPAPRALRRDSPTVVAIVGDCERTYAPGGDERPAEFMRSLRWKQFTDLWVVERRRQLQAASESKR